ncbi:MAG: DUF4860 domain-containing protein [Oscillospiraceae bacterium]
MKRFQHKSLADTVGTIGSMLLFLLFATCMLMIISVAAATYNRISQNFDNTFGVTASLRYVSNKLKSSESAEIINDGTALILKNGEVVSVVYFTDGGLYERSFSSDEVPQTEGGEKIFELSSIKIEKLDEIYKISVSNGKEDNFTLVRG